MAIVSLKIGGRYYKFSCKDGQEEYMRNLAAELDEKAQELLKSIGFIPESQLLAMVCILMAEENSKLVKANSHNASIEVKNQLRHGLSALAARVEGFTQDINALIEKEG